ncbi:MAG: Holliday junction resolvase RuvX [Planctomycetales bacterium]|nr:Holliday junction resolvase RuvX [Planctomycetales bacterium]
MKSKGRIAGIDYGTKRIGIAITDPAQSIASPYENYNRSGPEADAKRFKRLVSEDGIVLFVVGLPLHVSGDESQKSFEARQFGAWLHELTNVPVEFFDERYTSSESEAFLIEIDMSRKQRKKRLDMLAAQLILKGYLERRDLTDG